MAVFATPLAEGVSYDAVYMNSPIYMMGGFVIPGYLEELKVEASATVGKVKVNTGAAIAHFSLYLNDADLELSIDAAANNRIDLIVLRSSDPNQTVRATVIKGTAAANPAPPAYVAEQDLPLAWIWVPSGFNPAANTINTEDVHDSRTFKRLGVETAITGTSYYGDGSLENLMYNSEFLVYSGVAVGAAPEGWRIAAAGGTISSGGAPLTPQARGQAINITGNAGQGMQTQVRVTPGLYTIKGVLNVAGGTARIAVDGVNYDFKRTGADTEFLIRHYETGNEITIEALSNSAGANFDLGQIMVVQGYVPGHLRQKHEVIMLDYPLTDAAWTATAKSTGTTVIDLAASFGSVMGQLIRGLILRLGGRDSGSLAAATGACHMCVTSTVAGTTLSRLELAGQPDNKYRDVIAFAPMVGGFGKTFSIDVVATGAGTFDATIEIIGMVI